MCRRRRPSGVELFAVWWLSRGGRRRPPREKPAAVTEDDPAPEAAPSTKNRKLGTAVGELGVSNSFAMELMGTCAAPGGRMSSPELRESSTRMLEVTGGRWPKHVHIPHAVGEDFFTSRMARDLRVFPYGWNIAVVVSTVMNKPPAPGSSKVPESSKAVGAGGTKSAPDGAAKVRELPSSGKRVADFDTNISVDDYLVGKHFF
jgi:hypothetical protein